MSDGTDVGAKNVNPVRIPVRATALVVEGVRQLTVMLGKYF